MKKRWSRLKTVSEKEAAPKGLSNWFGEQNPMPEYQEGKVEDKRRTEPYVDNKPIEPQGKRLSRPTILKWIIFLVFTSYILISYYHAPILTRLGKYLVVQDVLKKADLIVCMMGSPVERGLAAADLYHQKMAPRILIAREDLPSGIEVLKKRGVHYPEARELLEMMLTGLGVAKSDLLSSERFAGNTLEEVKLIRDVVQRNGFRSLIVVTSPTHTRRTWLTFRNVFGKVEVDIMMAPSHYSDFRPEDWWKKRKYGKAVIIEYQKLIYYMLKYSH
jgi:uncharacterized SAM-binding protein YcdF (DUF218 family)